MAWKLDEKPVNKAYLGLTLGAAVSVVGAFFIGDAFFEYRKAIVSQQEEQLLTIARSVASSMTLYTESYQQDLAMMEGNQVVLQAGADRWNPLIFTALAKEYVRSQQPNVKNMFLTASEGAVIAAAVEGNDYKCVYRLSRAGSRFQQAIYQDASGKYYIGVSIVGADHSRMTTVLDIKVLFDKIVSRVRVGRKGYVMIKDGNGLILMHPVTGQIGLDVLEGRRRQFPDYDFSELKELIKKQKQGREGIYTYNSYWWADNVSQKVRKISAYTPVNFEAGFLIVSAVMDYNDIAVPVTAGVIKISLLTVLMLAILMAFVILLIHSIRSRNQFQQENQYLRELNAVQEELHKNEQQLAHYQRLQTIATLTGGIAHEFNNLLTPIMGYSGRILTLIGKEDEIYEDVQEIYDSSVKAKEIIQQISVLNRKNVELTYKYLPIRERVESALKVAYSIKPANVRMIQQIDIEASTVFGNETQIHQVIFNLCANAFYAMAGGGTLTVKGDILFKRDLDQRLVAKKDCSRYAKLIFEDTGEGIDESVLPRIFDPFFTTKPVGEGTGLGLSIVQNIIESHGGGITVASTRQAGSVFTVYLPLADREGRTEAGIAKGKPGREVVVAVVTGDPRLNRVLNRYLSQLGYGVECFDHPRDLLRALESGRLYDVVIAGELMLGMNRDELVLKVRIQNPAVKIMIVADLVKKELIEAKRRRVIDAYLPKSAGCQEIGSRLAGLLAGE